MTEYEAASLALQHATLSLGYWQVGATLVVGLVQCALIAWGVSVMKGSNASRDATLVQRQGEALQRQGEALQRQGEALQRQGEAFQHQQEALQRQGEASQHQQEALQRQGEVLADVGAGIRELLRDRAERRETRGQGQE